MIKSENVRWLLSEWNMTPNQFLSFTPPHQFALVQAMTKQEGAYNDLYQDREVFRRETERMLSI